MHKKRHNGGQQEANSNATPSAAPALATPSPPVTLAPPTSVDPSPTSISLAEAHS